MGTFGPRLVARARKTTRIHRQADGGSLGHRWAATTFGWARAVAAQQPRGHERWARPYPGPGRGARAPQAQPSCSGTQLQDKNTHHPRPRSTSNSEGHTAPRRGRVRRDLLSPGLRGGTVAVPVLATGAGCTEPLGRRRKATPPRARRQRARWPMLPFVTCGACLRQSGFT